MVKKTKKQTKKWKQRNGIKIRICDMSNSHLKNTIKFLEKCAALQMEISLLQGYKLLNSLNGEMAIWSIENQIENMSSSDFLPEIYYNMQKDLLRRESDV
jgi:hypothetical protein